jgi:hypothetical protein
LTGLKKIFMRNALLTAARTGQEWLSPQNRFVIFRQMRNFPTTPSHFRFGIRDRSVWSLGHCPLLIHDALHNENALPESNTFFFEKTLHILRHAESCQRDQQI